MINLTKNWVWTALFLAVFSCNKPATQSLPVNLKCEHLDVPIGIDTKKPRLTWQMESSREGASQQACRIIVGTDSSEVVRGTGNVWDSGKMNSEVSLVVYQGRELVPFTKYFWAVQISDEKGSWSDFSKVSAFETGMMKQENWQGSWIMDSHDYNLKPAPYFRKAIDIQKKIKSARVYIVAGGLYELYMNGSKIGNHRLDPIYTRFDRRNLYVTYDVTSNLTEGENAVGVVLGNGWFNHQSTAVWYFDKAPWRARPKFCLDLRITYEDGTEEIISSGDDWKTSHGPIIFNSIYTAEHYDARLEQKGWNQPGFDDSEWENAVCTGSPSQNIVAQVLHPIRNVTELPAVKMEKVGNNTYLFDFGRNISGVVQIKVEGAAGTEIRLKHVERLDAEGRADMSNIDVHYRPVDDSDPFQTDIFILSGKGEETFMPLFNYKGFQYVEVSSSKPVNLSKQNVTAYFMHSDVPPAGTIRSSNPTLDKIWQATNASYLSNLVGIPTDCPQREKNGWTGDAHIAIETGLYNFDAITVYEKWLADHRDEQQPNGVLPAIIPSNGWGYQWANGPDWTSTIAIIPWNIYLFYGDTHLLETCYDNIRRYVDRITAISPDGLTDWGLGDWVPVKSKTPKEFTSSVYYFVDATILAKAAKLFGKQADYEKYSALAEKIKSAINDKYLDAETGMYGSGFQTELSVALHWGIVPEELTGKVAENLSKRVIADNSHIDVGLLGTKSILNALSENGYADLAYTVATQESFPSWGWWIVNGATTLYENWPIDAKRDLSMNHIMFGEISAWFYKALGGIFPDEAQPGFKNILLKPNFVSGLDHFEATHNSPYGTIVSSWRRNGQTISYDVAVPANSTAELTVQANRILENGKELSENNHIQVEKNGNEMFTLYLKSGRYDFTIEK
jgi:alpha-L-rhamnosidase